MPVHAGERAKETGGAGSSVYILRTKEPRARTATRKRKSARKRTRDAATKKAA